MEYKLQACVTGYGIVDALGFTPQECYDNYMSDLIPVTKIKNSTDIDTYFSVDASKLDLPASINAIKMSKQTALALHTTWQALKMSNVQSSNVAVIAAVGTPADSYEEYFSSRYGGLKARLGPRKLLDTIPGSCSATICNTFGFSGPRMSMAAACTTGLAAIDYAIRIVNEYDHVIVCTSEIFTETLVYIFNSLGALSNESMPFDTNRSGFVAGEGSGCLIIESEKRAKARNAKIHANIFLPGSASDQSGDTLPDPEGRGAKEAMQKALFNAGINATEIDFINAHATSTKAGDEVEYNAIRQITNAPIYSCKGKIGHLLTSCNINEIIYSIIFSAKGHGGFNCNLKHPIASYDNLPVAPIFIEKKQIVTLKNSLGFGGRCMSLLTRVDR
jgi:3-oxoacyl-[acyl-carrier-protein] synthase II